MADIIKITIFEKELIMQLIIKIKKSFLYEYKTQYITSWFKSNFIKNILYNI